MKRHPAWMASTAPARQLILTLLLDSLTFGLIVAFIVLGVIGILIPMIPGTLLIWTAVLIYVLINGLGSIGTAAFVIITLIALATGTADFWMPLLGATTGGASRRALFMGVVGGFIGTLFAPLIGTVIGYAAGLLLGEYQKRGDWNEALKASAGGVAGWGLATAIQLGGGLLMLLIFVWRALSA
jgi:uncharacterized protein YqgC (DUF456 family)